MLVLAATVVVPDSGYVASAALLITSVVGAFAYRLSRRAEGNAESIGGANTAIKGLEILAKQHASEIARLTKQHDDCQRDNQALRESVAHLSGQVVTLTALTTGSASKVALELAAKDAKEAVDEAAYNARTAVEEAKLAVTRERLRIKPSKEDTE